MESILNRNGRPTNQKLRFSQKKAKALYLNFRAFILYDCIILFYANRIIKLLTSK